MYRAGILGAGKIAGGYGAPGEAAPYCHAGGIDQSDRVELAAVADISEKARDGFRDKWGACFPNLNYHAGLRAMLDAEDLDIVAVCIRGPQHAEAVLQAIEAGCRAIFLEKPPACSLEEMDGMVAAAESSGIPITVSYSRHWGPHCLRMAELIKGGLIGKVTAVVGYCDGAVLSYAAHTTDMICQFAGHSPRAVFARGRVGEADVPAGYEREPSLDSMIIEFADGVTGTQIGANGDSGAFYCDITGTEGRAKVPFYSVPSAWRKGGEAIDLDEHGMPETASPFKLAYDQIAGHLDGGPKPDCTDGDFVAVHEIGFGAVESILTDRRVTLPNTNRTRKVFANG